jgi:integrase/recombinase XerD
MTTELVTVENAVANLEPFNPSMHPVRCYLASLSAGSRRTMQESLDSIARLISNGAANADTLTWDAMRHQHVQAIRSELASRYSASTANKMLAALKGCLKEAWKLGLLDHEAYLRAVDIKPVKGETLPAGRGLEAGEIKALFLACSEDQSAAGKRDAALLALAVGCGLRRSEIAGLDLADFNPATGELKIRNGKGNKERMVYLAGGARRAVDAWLSVRGGEPGALLVPVNKGGRVTIKPLTAQAVYNSLGKRAQEAGVASFSPHDCRRSFISSLLAENVDLVTVQKLAGHANVNVTARYDRRPAEAARQAVGRLHIPFAG